MRPRITIITGPQGSGKSTLARQMCNIPIRVNARDYQKVAFLPFEREEHAEYVIDNFDFQRADVDLEVEMLMLSVDDGFTVRHEDGTEGTQHLGDEIDQLIIVTQEAPMTLPERYFQVIRIEQ